MSGKVRLGDQRGRALGFPTANIHCVRTTAPLAGVFVVSVKDMNDKIFYGVANLGTRPTIDGTRLMLEVHLFNFSSDIYGHYLEVIFLDKIRDEKRFENLDALKTQIALDVKQAELLLSL